jgi:hypothetical protein
LTSQPWLKLPPTSPGLFPDFVNTPQLTNAANCYLARYPPSSHQHSTGVCPLEEPKSHLDWFHESMFQVLSAHHPLISPGADASSPFVRHTLDVLAKRRVRVLFHCGTAEWFHGPIVDLAAAAKDAGVNSTLVEIEGGLHSEACLSWPEQGGVAETLQQSILACLGCKV